MLGQNELQVLIRLAGEAIGNFKRSAFLGWLPRVQAERDFVSNRVSTKLISNEESRRLKLSILCHRFALLVAPLSSVLAASREVSRLEGQVDRHRNRC